jgi:hypothetical protein
MASSASKTYQTHDNGGRPFEVIVKSKPGNKTSRLSNGIVMTHKSVDVWRLNDDEPVKRLYRVLQIKEALVFIGVSPKIPPTEFSGGYGPNFIGNTILIRDLSDNAYYMIHTGIDRFYLPQGVEIIKFISPVGNNDVPYAYAFDNYDNVYLLDAMIVMYHGKKRKYSPKDVVHQHIPYYGLFYYVQANPFNTYFTLYDPKDKEWLNVGWSANPGAEYNRFAKNKWIFRTTPAFDGVGGNLVDRDDYVVCCKAYARKFGLGQLKHKCIEPRFVSDRKN